MQGGFAAYARSGFFQLVLVALITILVELPALTMCASNQALRVLCVIVSLLTMVMDVSAFMRMRLYILTYGLTLLRVLTMWAMGVIAAVLGLIIAKCIRQPLKLSPILMTIVLCSWVALNYTNVSARIADYNVAAYNSGALAVLDVDYLAELSPDVRPALARVENPEVRAEALERVPGYAGQDDWYYWNLGDTK